MVNTSIKGRAKEKMCADELIKDGYKILFRSQRIRFGRIDFGALFDVVGCKPAAVHDDGSPCYADNTRWRFISCKHHGSDNGGLTIHKSELLHFKSFSALEGMSVELWVWHKPGYHGRGKKRHFEKGHWDIISF